MNKIGPTTTSFLPDQNLKVSADDVEHRSNHKSYSPFSMSMFWYMLVMVAVALTMSSVPCYLQLRNYGHGVTEFSRRLEILENGIRILKRNQSEHQDIGTNQPTHYIKVKEDIMSPLPPRSLAREVRDVGDERHLSNREVSRYNIGLRGSPGRDGRGGLPGRDGRDGTPGLPGVPGTAGVPGPIGPRGDTGPQGEKARPGVHGLKGDTGLVGLPGLRGDFGECCSDQTMGEGGTSTLSEVHESAYDTVNNVNNRLRNMTSSATSHRRTTGSIYTRWGRTTCPDTGAELVYEGLAGGSHYSHKGGSASYVCLPNDPEWGNYLDSFQSHSYMYGAEYEVSSFDPFLHTNSYDAAIHDSDVPCALCRVPTRGAKLMIPARTECPEKWTLEYQGYLVAGHYAHNGRHTFECMDKAPEIRLGTNPNQDGAMFHVAEGNCGSLPCAPYVGAREVTCVVCTI